MNEQRTIISIDANVILRYLLDDCVKYSAKASEIFADVESGGALVKCDPVNFAEVIWVLSSVYKLSNEEIRFGLEPIIQLDGFLMQNKAHYLHALNLFANTAEDFGDACACAAALEECEGRLYSFDAELSKIEGLDRRESVRK